MRARKNKLGDDQTIDRLRPSATLRKYAQLIASGARGPILDAPCGYGRNALLFGTMGLDVYCVDIDEVALTFLSQQRCAGSMICLKEDLNTIPPSLCSKQFAAILNIHFVAPHLVPWWKDSLIPGGYLYIETFDNRGENYRQLPRSGEIQEILKDDFDFVLNQERHAGPDGTDAVTVRLLAQKRL